MSTIGFDLEYDGAGKPTGRVVVRIVVDPKNLKSAVSQIADEANRRKQLHRALIHATIGVLQMGDMAIAQSDEELISYTERMKAARPVDSGGLQKLFA